MSCSSFPHGRLTQCFKGIKSLDCFRERLVWDDCLSLGSSWVCVTKKNGCDVHAVSGVSISSHCVVQGAQQDHILKALEGISVAY